MAGGLIQIVAYGIHDVFLIGNPQITFFKLVYRRHTNFSMEYIEEQFNGIQNFGGYLTCNISKVGDLMHHLYLKINIPQVALNKLQYSNKETNLDNPYLIFQTSYNLIQKFINNINFNIIQPLYKLLNINNLKYSEVNSQYLISQNRMNYNINLNLISQISINFNKSFNIPLNNNIINTINRNISTKIVNILDFNIYYNLYILSNSSNINYDLQLLLDNYFLQLHIIKSHLNEMLLFYKNINNIMLRQNINFAWVEYLGHQIINKVEIEIGGKVIDYTDAVRMNINYQLTNKILHDITYSKLIGNIEELTTFDSTIKGPYIMYIPLDFWFNKYSGLSIPLIYLRYHDVKINVKLNDLINCCYYENLNSDTVIEELIILDSVTLIINYIYLDTDERCKFAQLSHEYLIDQTQIANFTNIQTINLNIELPFFNPIKQLYWVIRDNANIRRLKYFEYSSNYYVDIYEFNNLESNSILNINKNLIKIKTVEYEISNYLKVGDLITITNSIYYNGSYLIIKIDNEYIYIQYDYFMKEEYNNNYTVLIKNGYKQYIQTNNYTGNSQAFIYKINNINPIKYSTLELNGVQRFYKVDGLYTNFVQPYQSNSKSPNFGLNTYSFALAPEEYQPSGFCNFNKIDLKTMTFEFNSSFINQNINKTLDVLIYGHSYNILKFAYGKAGIILNI